MRVAEWQRFVQREAGRFEGKTRFRFATSAGRVTRYLEFVEIIAQLYGRFGEAASATNLEFFREEYSTPWVELPPEFLDLLERAGRLGRLVELEIESFFLFAKILLDTTALFIEDCFGPGLGRHRIASHGALLKFHVEYGKAKGIVYPAGFAKAVAGAFNLVCTYRNEQIAHQMAAEIVRAPSYTVGELPALATVPLFPKPGDRRTLSPNIGKVTKAIDRYLALVRKLIVTNWVKSTFQTIEDPALPSGKPRRTRRGARSGR